MSEIELKTTPRVPRFPHTNQAQHCWTCYNEWILCLKRTKSNEDACFNARKLALSLCPMQTLEQWDEQREHGIFPGLQLD